MSAILVTRAAWTRKPESELDALLLWSQDEDFYIIQTGQYMNKRDFERYGSMLDSVVFVGDNMNVTFAKGIL